MNALEEMVLLPAEAVAWLNKKIPADGEDWIQLEGMPPGRLGLSRSGDPGAPIREGKEVVHYHPRYIVMLFPKEMEVCRLVLVIKG